jgi:hypothetical protein
VFENALYFGATAPATGDELYRIADINPGAGSSFPGDFALFP